MLVPLVVLTADKLTIRNAPGCVKDGSCVKGDIPKMLQMIDYR